MGRTIDGRLAYADLLRAAATIAVITLHMAGSQMGAVDVTSSAWNVFNVYNGLVRWCVPVFVMLSGMFLLDPKKGERLSHTALRILRIFIALVVWAAVYALANHVATGGALSWAGFKSALWSAVLGNTHYHLWFLYMIIGLYLITPILRAFVRGASRADFHYFFLLTFVVAFLLPTLLRFRPSQTVSLYLNRLNIHLVLGYVGFYVAGYYLKAYTIGRIAEALIYVLGIAGAFVTVGGTSLLSHRAGALNDILYGYMTPNVAAMAVAVFVLFRYVLGISDERDRRRRMSGVARVSFGIYLVHDLFIMLLRALDITTLSFSPLLSVPVLSAVVFLLSFAVAWLLAKIPFIGPYLT